MNSNQFQTAFTRQLDLTGAPLQGASGGQPTLLTTANAKSDHQRQVGVVDLARNGEGRQQQDYSTFYHQNQIPANIIIQSSQVTTDNISQNQHQQTHHYMQQRAAQDDGKIVDEIEKTIQGLLNLNIFETFSNSEDNDSKNNVSEGCAADTITNDVSNSEDKTSAESQSKDLINKQSSEKEQGDHGTALFNHKIESKESDRAADQDKKREFIQQCTQKIVQKIESENVQNMEQLGVLLEQYIQEYSQVYESKFMKSAEELDKIDGDINTSEKIRNENKLLKRAVKILYNRLSQTRHQQANMQTIVEQNSNLQRVLQAKDLQIQQMQHQMAQMRQMMLNMAQLQQQAQQNGTLQFDNDGFDGCGGQGQGGCGGFRDGDVF